MNMSPPTVNDTRIALSSFSLESQSFRLRGEWEITKRLPQIIVVDQVGYPGNPMFRLNRFVWGALKEAVDAIFVALDEGPQEDSVNQGGTN
jgi:hypothetical protein